MTRLWHSPGALLVVTGGLLGLTLPFGKLAGAAGASPLLWAFVISGGAGATLLAALLAGGGRLGLGRARLRYYAVAAAVSYAVPNVLLLSSIPHLGAGFTGIMFTLSPVITLGLSLLFRLRRPSLLGLAGIAVGFAGAVVVALTRGEAGRPADPVWVLAGLLIPFCLAAGNIYRTLDWPADAGPIELASGSHLASAAMLAAAMALTGGAAPAPLAAVPLLVGAQVIASAGMFAFFFRLQAVGGPVYLSQIGYVGAAVGLLAGTAFLGESYRWETWAGALVITVGLAMTTMAQTAAAKTRES